MLPVGRFSKTDAWIAGTWTDPGARFRVINPATGETIAEVADCGPEEARRAVEAAETAFRAWSGTSVYERSAVLWRLRDLMLEHREDLARLMSLEMGKPIKESRGEVVYAAGFVEWYAEEAKRIFGEIIPASTLEKRILIQAAPVGPVYGITPWNFPAAMVTRKLAPALAAGCSFILKPAEQSPLTALALAELLHEAGLPPGVFQVITTHDPAGVSQVILDDPRIRKLTFTGSTEVGSKLYAQAAATVKRVSLELGGHAPFLVFEDADLDKAVKEAVTCAFRNTGQTCVCANRIYVHEAVAGRFLEAFVEAVRGLKVGDPLDESTDIGPLVDQQGFDKVKAHVDDALRRGAKALLGGTPLAPGGRAGGYYFVLDGAGRRGRRHAGRARGDLRAGGPGPHLRQRRGGGAPGQRHPLRPCGLRLHQGREPGVPGHGGAGVRHRGRERRRAGHAPGALRRRKAVGRGPRGRDLWDRRVY